MSIKTHEPGEFRLSDINFSCWLERNGKKAMADWADMADNHDANKNWNWGRSPSPSYGWNNDWGVWSTKGWSEKDD